MKKVILEERNIIETIDKLPESSFIILDFMGILKELFPEKKESFLAAPG